MELPEYKQKALHTDYADYTDFHSGDASPRLDYAVTESAKALDIVKKSKKNLQSLDREKLVEELGDLLWYFNLTLDELGLAYEEVMEVNVRKIQKKHPPGDPLVRGEVHV